jgi:ubiquinone/menaquinone biosynthesis C-methylase UbiE
MKLHKCGVKITMKDGGKKRSKSCYYVCPVCKQPLTPSINVLCCQRDRIEYPVKNGIVDFVVRDLTESTNPVLRSAGKFDNLARIYEGPSWYGIMDKINSELGLPSIEEGAKAMTEMVDAENGVGLDVACGTGYMTRSLAQKMRLVYGIDTSMGMLEKAVEYAQEKGIGNVCFARSRAERLPFPDGIFDGVTCRGALHLFSDIVEALSEMARVLKAGARLAVLTIVKSDSFSFEDYLKTMSSLVDGLEAAVLFDEESLEKSLKALHIFDVKKLDKYLSQTGFRGFAYDIYGPAILFHAKKG